MKPKIFLSHSKKDKDFIVYLSDQLRLARIDSWYDDWEIPPGESIRKKIFEDGLPGCDIFLVYLTENSIDSYWVQKELDSMVTIESETKERLIIPFVSHEELRNKLPVDLRSINIPELNKANFNPSFIKLVARSWELFAKRQLLKQNEGSNHIQTKLSNQILELENKILQLQITGNADIEKIIAQLETSSYKFNGKVVSLKDIFAATCIPLSTGISGHSFFLSLKAFFNYKPSTDFWGENGDDHTDLQMSIQDILGKMIIIGVINRMPTKSEYINEEYHLTQLGVRLANQLTLK